MKKFINIFSSYILSIIVFVFFAILMPILLVDFFLILYFLFTGTQFYIAELTHVEFAQSWSFYTILRCISAFCGYALSIKLIRLINRFSHSNQFIVCICDGITTLVLGYYLFGLNYDPALYETARISLSLWLFIGFLFFVEARKIKKQYLASSKIKQNTHTPSSDERPNPVPDETSRKSPDIFDNSIKPSVTLSKAPTITPHVPSRKKRGEKSSVKNFPAVPYAISFVLLVGIIFLGYQNISIKNENQEIVQRLQEAETRLADSEEQYSNLLGLAEEYKGLASRYSSLTRKFDGQLSEMVPRASFDDVNLFLRQEAFDSALATANTLSESRLELKDQNSQLSDRLKHILETQSP